MQLVIKYVTAVVPFKKFDLLWQSSLYKAWQKPRKYDIKLFLDTLHITVYTQGKDKVAESYAQHCTEYTRLNNLHFIQFINQFNCKHVIDNID